MAEQIQVSYDELEQVAQQFGSQSENAQQIVQQITSAVDELRNGGWQSAQANNFYSEFDGEVLPALNRLVQALSEAQSATNQISTELANAEDEAASLFRI